MIQKPLKAKLEELVQQFIAILKDDKTEDDTQTVEPVEPSNPDEGNSDNTEGEGDPVEPELNGGFGGA